MRACVVTSTLILLSLFLELDKVNSYVSSIPPYNQNKEKSLDYIPIRKRNLAYNQYTTLDLQVPPSILSNWYGRYGRVIMLSNGQIVYNLVQQVTIVIIGLTYDGSCQLSDTGMTTASGTSMGRAYRHLGNTPMHFLNLKNDKILVFYPASDTNDKNTIFVINPQTGTVTNTISNYFSDISSSISAVAVDSAELIGSLFYSVMVHGYNE